MKEKRFNRLLGAANIGMYEISCEEKTLALSEESCSLLGIASADQVCCIDQLYELVHEDDHERYYRLLKQVAENESPLQVTFRIRRPADGAVVWIEQRGSCYREEDSQKKIISGFQWDVTAQALREEHLTHHIQQQAEYMSMAGHELKIPVTCALAYAELLTDRTGNGTDIASLTEKIGIQMSRLSDMIRRLLDRHTFSIGDMALAMTRFDLNMLVHDLIDEFEKMTDIHRFNFMPSQPDEPVTADQARIREVIANLITNAIKYSPRGGNILIATHSLPGAVSFVIRDEGIGIPKAEQDKIFNRFFRVMENNDNAVDGSGLGLYICSMIIQQHGGHLWVESDEGCGSTFGFQLPGNTAGDDKKFSPKKHQHKIIQ